MLKYLIMLLILSVSLDVSAQMYQWVDKNGILHVSDSPPSDSPGAQVKQLGKGKTEVKRAPSEAAESGGHAASKMIFLDKLYRYDELDSEKARLEKSLQYYQEDCKNDKRHNTQTPEFWEKYCEDVANRTQRSLDVLTSDPDRYYYVIDQANKKARGETVDNPPAYQQWN